MKEKDRLKEMSTDITFYAVVMVIMITVLLYLSLSYLDSRTSEIKEQNRIIIEKLEKLQDHD